MLKPGGRLVLRDIMLDHPMSLQDAITYRDEFLLLKDVYGRGDLEPLTFYEEHCKARRVQITLCSINGCFSFYHCNVYGWTNNHECQIARGRTNSLCLALLDELACLPPLPACIFGDINADTDDIAALKTLLEQHHWTDFEAIADMWGQEASVATCLTARSNEPTRRDYIFCNPVALQLVRGFHVRSCDLCPTHATTEMHLDLTAPAFHMFHSLFPGAWTPWLTQYSCRFMANHLTTCGRTRC